MESVVSDMDGGDHVKIMLGSEASPQILLSMGSDKSSIKA